LTTREHEYWQTLKRDGNGDYKKAKNRVADELIAFFERKVGPIKDKIVMTDIATPSTVIRYTGNWKGSCEGWMITPDIGRKQMKQTLPGLDNFYMAGHWVQAGGGLPSALMSGRKAAQLICLEDKVSFQSE
jgi:phytoene dehydrogenase-like protein